jgi:hypothetical protein
MAISSSKYPFTIFLWLLLSSYVGQKQLDSLNANGKHGVQIDALNSYFTGGYINYSVKYTFEKKKIKFFIGPSFGQKLGVNLSTGWTKEPNTLEIKGFNFGTLYSLSKPTKTFQWTIQYDFNLSDFNLIGAEYEADSGYDITNYNEFDIRNTIAPGFRIKIKNKIYINSNIGAGIGYYKTKREFRNGVIDNWEGSNLELSINLSLEYKI